MADGVDSLMYDLGAGKSAIREVFEQTMELKQQGVTDFWDYSIGNPNVPVAPQVTEAIREALEEYESVDLHGYPPNNGYLTTRQTVAANLNRRFDAHARAGEIAMTAGCAGAITSTIAATTRAGEEVIIPTPYYAEYRMWVQAWHCNVVEVPTEPETFQLDLDAIEEAINPKTRMVIINTPNNPVGAVYTRESLQALAAMLREREEALGRPLYLISDEPYREITYGAEVPWVPAIYDRTIVCYSYSKSLSLPGERIGWVLVPNTNPDHDKLVLAVAGAGRKLGFVCAPAIFQRVVIDCIDEPSDVEAYAENRRALTEGLSALGYEFVEPQGAFYLWVKALEPDANAFFERAKSFELLPVPSDSFGCPGWVRVGYCVAHETIVNSMPAWKKLAESYK